MNLDSRHKYVDHMSLCQNIKCVKAACEHFVEIDLRFSCDNKRIQTSSSQPGEREKQHEMHKGISYN